MIMTLVRKSCSDLHFDCILLPATARNVRRVLKTLW